MLTARLGVRKSVQKRDGRFPKFVEERLEVWNRRSVDDSRRSVIDGEVEKR